MNDQIDYLSKREAWLQQAIWFVIISISVIGLVRLIAVFYSLSSSIRQFILWVTAITRDEYNYIKPDHNNQYFELKPLQASLQLMAMKIQSTMVSNQTLLQVDPLTSLYNRRIFSQKLTNALKDLQLYDKECHLMVLDIDHFKRINEQYGRDIGDAVLKFVSDEIKSTTYCDDTISRIGGEEFGIICTSSDRQHALRMAEKIRRMIESFPFVHEDITINITASIGFASANQNSTVVSLVKKADTLLYHAKMKGRNQICSDDISVFSVTSQPEPGAPTLDLYQSGKFTDQSKIMVME